MPHYAANGMPGSSQRTMNQGTLVGGFMEKTKRFLSIAREGFHRISY